MMRLRDPLDVPLSGVNSRGLVPPVTVDGQVYRRNGAAVGWAMPGKRIVNTDVGAQNNWAPAGLAGNTFMEWAGGSQITISGIAGGQDGQMLTIRNSTASLVMTLLHNSGSSSVGNKLFNIATTGATSIAGSGTATFVYDASAQFWVLISHTQGQWINPAFNAGDFTANGGGGTWTVGSPQIKYCLNGRQLTLGIYSGASTVGGAPTDLRIANGQWGGFTTAAGQFSSAACAIADAGAVSNGAGMLRMLAATTFVQIFKNVNGTAFTAGAGTVIEGSVTFEVG